MRAHHAASSMTWAVRTAGRDETRVSYLGAPDRGAMKPA
jgi:hypothetical protein